MTRRIESLVILSVAILLAAEVTVPAATVSSAISVFPEPGMTNPFLRFGTGKALNNKPEVVAGLPSGTRPSSAWYIAQWGHDQFLSAGLTPPDGKNYNDPLLGRPLYTFETANAESRVSIYNNSDRSSFIYELFEQGGVLRGGGADLFLSAEALHPLVTFKHSIYYSVDVKLSQAAVHYNNEMAAKSGAVLAQVGSGFVVKFDDPNSKFKATLFLQIPISGSHDAGGPYRKCSLHKGVASAIANIVLPGQTLLPFEASREGPIKLRYKLNNYLEEFLKKPILCRGNDSRVTDLQSQTGIRSLSNWSLGGMYIGIESEDSVWHGNAAPHVVQGSVQTALQLSGLVVSVGPANTCIREGCIPP